MTKRLFVGTSGFSYKHWSNDVFYPSGLDQRSWLEFYARYFNTVELNVTFYRLPRPESFLTWQKITPSDFTFSIKGSRYITHVKKLKDCLEPVDLFFSRAAGLKNKLTVVLWQLPPGLHFDRARLQDFLALLQKNQAAKTVRHAFEFRHQSWFCPETYNILRSFDSALCIAHSNCWPCEEKITADFVYLRLHGGSLLYESNYTSEELVQWANKIKKWLKKRLGVYAYFNNDAYGYAIKNALELVGLITKKA